MKDIINIGGRLTLICAIAAAILGLMNAVTEPKIEQIKQERLEQALSRVSEGMTVGDPREVSGNDKISTYYPLFRGGNEENPDGYICRIIGAGYGGEMIILAGFKPEGEVFAVQMMENQETPGLGKEAEKASYMEKYIGKGNDEPFPLRKDMLSQEQADSITGATITFIGVAKALVAGSDFVQELGEN